MKYIFISLYYCLLSLFLLGAVFAFFAKIQIVEYFYLITIIATIISFLGCFKKNKLIFSLAIPGLLRLWLYVTSEEVSLGMLGLHLVAFFLPLLVTYKVYRLNLRKC